MRLMAELTFAFLCRANARIRWENGGRVAYLGVSWVHRGGGGGTGYQTGRGGGCCLRAMITRPVVAIITAAIMAMMTM